MDTSYITTDLIKLLESHDKFRAIKELAGLFRDKNICTDVDHLISALIEREQIMSTGIGFGIAIPHVKIDSVTNVSLAVGISPKGIDFDSMDGKPVHLIILIIANEHQQKEYLNTLSTIMTRLKKPETREKIISSTSPEEIMSILNQ